jgi:hypothetical protein
MRLRARGGELAVKVVFAASFVMALMTAVAAVGPR